MTFVWAAGSYRVWKHDMRLLYEKLATMVCGNVSCGFRYYTLAAIVRRNMSRGFCARSWQLS